MYRYNLENYVKHNIQITLKQFTKFGQDNFKVMANIMIT
jgi:hypothetical protein